MNVAIGVDRLAPLRAEPLPMDEKKRRDLHKMVPYIGQEYHHLYPAVQQGGIGGGGGSDIDEPSGDDPDSDENN